MASQITKLGTELELRLHSAETDERSRWPLTNDGRVQSGDAWLSALPGATRVVIADGGAAGVWRLTLAADFTWVADVSAQLEVRLTDPAPASVYWPRYYGVVEREQVTASRESDFRGPGRTLHELPDERRLGLPLAVLETTGSRWLVGADPAFSTTIAVEPDPGGGIRIRVGWRWLAAAGVHREETRRIFVVPVPSLRAALDQWFDLATPQIPAGPAWLHEIALQNYDYLSKNGRGWFADIDAACKLIVPDERHRAIFTLHAWYDTIGRYTYDPVAKRLDERWVAFPFADTLPDRVTPITHPARPGVPSGPANHGWRHPERCRPVPLAWADVRERLGYAKERGIRTALYVMTGMLTSGEPAEAIERGDGLDVEPHWPGGWWQGPDLELPAHVMNPLHPDVTERFNGYIEALLEKVGDLTDALVMDEAYYVPRGALGPPSCPGYADRGQIGLVQTIARLCHEVRPDLAFLTADELGVNFLRHDVFPYSLFADGIYHDAWCLPESWDCVRFPAWRNVAWSATWAPVTNIGWTRWAVLAHNAPVAVSNGSFGDDTGLAELDDATAEEIGELWRIRTSRPWEKTVRVTDGVELGG
jgi:hypothetical protein